MPAVIRLGFVTLIDRRSGSDTMEVIVVFDPTQACCRVEMHLAFASFE